MGKKSPPTIKSCKASENWTCVTFKPDLAKFGMSELEDDTVALMRKRVYDLAGVLGKGVKVIHHVSLVSTGKHMAMTGSTYISSKGTLAMLLT